MLLLCKSQKKEDYLELFDLFKQNQIHKQYLACVYSQDHYQNGFQNTIHQPIFVLFECSFLWVGQTQSWNETFQNIVSICSISFNGLDSKFFPPYSPFICWISNCIQVERIKYLFFSIIISIRFVLIWATLSMLLSIKMLLSIPLNWSRWISTLILLFVAIISVYSFSFYSNRKILKLGLKSIYIMASIWLAIVCNSLINNKHLMYSLLFSFLNSRSKLLSPLPFNKWLIYFDPMTHKISLIPS